MATREVDRAPLELTNLRTIRIRNESNTNRIRIESSFLIRKFVTNRIEFERPKFVRFD
jgi:hypothetical protein